jgi:hypothetical protein
MHLQGDQDDCVLLRSFALPGGTLFSSAGDGSFTATVNGVILRVQGSRDLAGWETPISQTASPGDLPALPGEQQYFTFSLPAGNAPPRGFIRLTATLAK